MININRNHMISSLKKQVRYDGRSLLEIREPFKIETGVSLTAEGSAKVTLGKTVVLAGVKLELTTPYADTPTKGSLMVNAELIPLSSSEYEPGPPTEKGIEVGRVIDKALREGKAVDFEKLCVVEGEKVWMVIVDIVPLNDDGNLIDVGTIAALAALKNARMPLVENNVVDYQTKTEQMIPLNEIPLAVTVHMIEKNIIVDATVLEEAETDARLTVAINQKDYPCALQKGGETPLSGELLGQMIDIAIETSKKYRAVLNAVK